MIKIAAQWWYIGRMSSMLKISYLTTGLIQLLAQEERCDDGWMFITHKLMDKGVAWRASLLSSSPTRVAKQVCLIMMISSPWFYSHIMMVTKKSWEVGVSLQTCLLARDPTMAEPTRQTHTCYFMQDDEYKDGNDHYDHGDCDCDYDVNGYELENLIKTPWKDWHAYIVPLGAKDTQMVSRTNKQTNKPVCQLRWEARWMTNRLKLYGLPRGANPAVTLDSSPLSPTPPLPLRPTGRVGNHVGGSDNGVDA